MSEAVQPAFLGANYFGNGYGVEIYAHEIFMVGPDRVPLKRLGTATKEDDGDWLCFYGPRGHDNYQTFQSITSMLESFRGVVDAEIAEASN